MSKKNVYYQVRTEGDGEFDYLIIPPEENHEKNYNPLSEESAKEFAKAVNGYVVKVTEEPV